ncbi:hypothetical protein I5501_23285 [Citrobacter freundii]|nr:hypothetical protein [Citrobacter freundii]
MKTSYITFYSIFFSLFSIPVWAACQNPGTNTKVIYLDTVDNKSEKDIDVIIDTTMSCRASPGGATTRNMILSSQSVGNNAGSFRVQAFGAAIHNSYTNNNYGSAPMHYRTIPCNAPRGCPNFRTLGNNVTIRIKKGDTINHGTYDIFRFQVKIGKDARYWTKTAQIKITGTNKPSPTSCFISNKGNAYIDFKRLQAGSGIHQKYYDALISCTRPASFKYRLHSSTPQITSLPTEENNDRYLGVGLGVVNGALWVSSVNNSTPLALSGRLNTTNNPYIRINSRINSAAKNISSTGGQLSGSAILEIIAD